LGQITRLKGETVTRDSNVGRQWREAERIIRQSGRPVPFDELHHQLVERGVEVGGKSSLRHNLSRAPNLFVVRKRGYWLKTIPFTSTRASKEES
jgi:hypothetical protein